MDPVKPNPPIAHDELSQIASTPVAGDVSVQAIRASGAIVEVAPKDFLELLSRAEKPLLVATRTGYIRRRFIYLMPYRGLVFVTRALEPLAIQTPVEVVRAEHIWLPD